MNFFLQPFHLLTQGSPGAFSEAAALKAYPECETVPCEQFEVAFKVQLHIKLDSLNHSFITCATFKSSSFSLLGS